MSTVIDKLESAQLRKVPNFDPGDRVRVHFQVIEGTRKRTQVFEGFVIKRQGSGLRETFTVRKQSFGVGVERTFPVHSPKIEQIEVAARGEVRRAKLYYLRDRIGKAARVRERAWAPQDAHGSIDDAELVAPEEPEETGDDTFVDAEIEAAAAESTTDTVEEAPEEAQEEAPTDDVPAEEAPADDAPAEEASAEEAPADEAPAEQASTDDAPAADDAPAETTDADSSADDENDADAGTEDSAVEDSAAEDSVAKEGPDADDGDAGDSAEESSDDKS